MTKKIIIIGGTSSMSAHAAMRARHINEDAEIVILQKNPNIPFLPWNFENKYKDNEKKLIRDLKLLNNIKIKLNHEVKKINPKEKTVEVINHDNNKLINEGYDKLIIAGELNPLECSIPKSNMDNIFKVWKEEHMEIVKETIEKNQLQKAVVVGGSIIGIEIIKELLNRGIKVTLIEETKQILQSFDPEMTNYIVENLKENGVDIFTEDTIKEFIGNEKIQRIQLESGTFIETDFVVVPLDVKANLEIIQEAGIQIGEQGGVKVNKKMQTNDPDIYAIGSIVEVDQLITGKKVINTSLGIEHKMAKIAGTNVAGGEQVFKGVLNTEYIDLQDITIAKTGLNEKEARKENYDFIVSYTPDKIGPGYKDPGKVRTLTKLIVENKTGNILGVQAVGSKGADKIIDIITTAIYGKLTCFDLENLDLLYKPPYSITRAAMVASNIIKGDLELIDLKSYEECLEKEEEVQIIDTRTMSDVDALGIIKESEVFLGVEEVRDFYDEEIELDKPVIVFCAIGNRSYLVYRILKQKGFNVKMLSGGVVVLNKYRES